MPHRLAWTVLLTWACALPSAAQEDDAKSLFNREIAPLLSSRCLSCHSAGVKKGGLDLSRRAGALSGGSSGEPAIVPKNPDEGELLAKLDAGEMPPKNPLPKDRIAALRKWIAAGAPYDHEPLRSLSADPASLWSLKPIANPDPPRLTRHPQPANPIDAFILSKLEQAGLEPAPEADRRTLIRRASFDLLGLPPTPEEVEAFVRDRREDAYARLIDRLLDSPHYGERWGRHWLDVVRFGESHGYETNMPRYNAWPYRDYVIRAFNRDLPYAEFIRDQLAADTLPEADALTRAATGFLVAGTHDEVGNATREGMLRQRMDDLDDIIAATGSTFLGLTIQCARCHDHKFDPISQLDYYSMQAVFSGVRHGEREIPEGSAAGRTAELARVRSDLASIQKSLDDLEPAADPQALYPRRSPLSPLRNIDRFEPTLAKYVRFRIFETSDGLEPCIDELEIHACGDSGANVALAASSAKASASSEYPNNPIHKIAHLNDGRESNDRSWISNEPGKGWAMIELAEPAMIDRVIWARDRTGKFGDRLAVRYQIECALDADRFRVVASSSDRATYSLGGAGEDPSANRYKERGPLLKLRDALRERLVKLSQVPKVYAGVFGNPEPTRLLKRGDPLQPGEPAPPATLHAIAPRLALDEKSADAERRPALAAWLSNPTNPLPPRVLVNRVWQYHFGSGIVATPNDFGALGAPPTHPELLDFLASEFRRNGGRIKPLHRLIMLSRTYRQASSGDRRGAERDSANALLWRFRSRRLEAEAIRDALLFTSGELNLAVGGPSYSIWEPNTNYVAVYNPLKVQGPETFRRMVYQLRPRGRLDGVFGVFDCPDAAQTSPVRASSTTAPQALALWNGDFVIARAQALTARARAEAGADPRARARRLFLIALGREPEAEELEAAAALVLAGEDLGLARALFNTSEFLTIP